MLSLLILTSQFDVLGISRATLAYFYVTVQEPMLNKGVAWVVTRSGLEPV